MAEIINNKKNTICKKINLKSTRVDLTPMVDLGFLLITFFVFTSSMMMPRVLDMRDPDDTKTVKDKLCESCVLTIILACNDAIYYYEGTEDYNDIKPTSFSVNGIRNLLREKKRKVTAARGQNEFALIVKPTEQCYLQNLVNMQDEASLSGVNKYYLAEPTPGEVAAVFKRRLSLQHD